ncbi:class I mannose-6-phosphate isomerase [Sphingobium sp. C100]|uniref:class I mannose-6-phosphate isomerase n=1 Tax=Sphingobium sp. C100 TaxID=1207055 RepID=UPI001F191D16|nr:class I mannose-6-phosphate isomerase [Sphingobium sp. C100]
MPADTMRKLQPRLVDKPWGWQTLPAPFQDMTGRQIGEIWFEDGPDEQPPLLVKYIFTSERLSIQVHPDDQAARAAGLPSGKEELWYIVDCEPGAVLGIGLKREMTPEAFRATALDGSIEQIIDWKPVAPGDCYFIPAGTVHAIGAGITLAEIQQNVDITYRLYDYGRPRELHLDQGLAVSRLAPYDRPVLRLPQDDDLGLLSPVGAPFRVSLHHWRQSGPIALPDELQLWFIPLSGSGSCGRQRWAQGECWLLSGDCIMSADGAAAALIASPA